MSQSATPTLRFAVPTALPLEARFDGGQLTSDGGLPCLARSRVWRRIMRSLGDGLLRHHRSSVRQRLDRSSLTPRVEPHLLPLPDHVKRQRTPAIGR